MTNAATQIRNLFLERKDTYTFLEAAEILGMELDVVLGWLEVGELEGIDTRDGIVLPWDELVSFGMSFWPQEAIEAALGRAARRPCRPPAARRSSPARPP